MKYLILLLTFATTLSAQRTPIVPDLPSNTGGKKLGQKYSHGVAKNAKESSKTFSGVAKAMASQYIKAINDNS